MTTPLLPLKSSDGWDVAVPVRLPDAISFDCFVPGLGLLRACLHPTSLDPAQADVGAVEAWRPTDPLDMVLGLVGRPQHAVIEQAGEVLAFVVDRLVWFGAESKLPQSPVLIAIADMTHAEAVAWEAWEKLPEAVRRGCSVQPRNPEAFTVMPSTDALAAYVDVLVEQAQLAATKAAKQREEAWLREQAEERAASARASRTDAAIDAAKEGR